jgi:hypothetical protein
VSQCEFRSLRSHVVWADYDVHVKAINVANGAVVGGCDLGEVFLDNMRFDDKTGPFCSPFGARF